jgi:hypothetical protein
MSERFTQRLTPYAAGWMPHDTKYMENGNGRIELVISDADYIAYNALPGGPSDATVVVTDLRTDDRYRYRVKRASCGTGCYCAAEARCIGREDVDFEEDD